MAKQDVNQASQTKRSPISCSSRRSWSTSQGRTPWGPAPGSSLAWRRSWLPRPIFCDKHILHICMNNSWNFHKNWMMFTCIFYVRKLASIWVSIPRAPCTCKHCCGAGSIWRTSDYEKSVLTSRPERCAISHKSATGICGNSILKSFYKKKQTTYRYDF